jgi:hypothetical protein
MKRSIRIWILKHFYIRKAIYRKCEICGEALNMWFIRDIHKGLWRTPEYKMWCLECCVNSKYRRHVHKRIFILNKLIHKLNT